MLKGFLAVAVIAASLTAGAATPNGDVLIKFKAGRMPQMQTLSAFSTNGGTVEALGNGWLHVKVAPQDLASFSTASFIETMQSNPDVEYVQPNYRLKMVDSYQSADPQVRQRARDILEGRVVDGFMPQSLFETFGPTPKPAIPGSVPVQAQGADPLLKSQWGMANIHAPEAWKAAAKMAPNAQRITVAVIDTGVDYTHEDLLPNMWRNPGEIADNNKDDDGNGYVDDIVGWDFAKNDNRPFDVTLSPLEIISSGGNPGHGTHCAGNVGARGQNGTGISGVYPNANIMALRFLTEEGSGTTADAVNAINYAVNNGAKVLSNSWGSEGEDPSENNQALKDAIKNAQDHDVLFIAAAGNGHNGVGYDNDSDPKPGTPASYDIANIISVAALDSSNRLGSFSNWGKKTVHVGAPGVAIFSTMVGNHYSDVVIDTMGIKATWDGTSMATPHVAGAAALIWSAHPEYKWSDVKNKLISTVDKVSALSGKSVSGGKINVAAAIK